LTYPSNIYWIRTVCQMCSKCFSVYMYMYPYLFRINFLKVGLLGQRMNMFWNVFIFLKAFYGPIIVDRSARFPIPYTMLDITDVFSMCQFYMLLICISKIEHFVPMTFLSVVCSYIFWFVRVPYILRALNFFFVV
jgi:hypothetical protein